MTEILRSKAIRSVSQGVPPRTVESATPNLDKDGSLKEKKSGIIKSNVRKKIPPSSPSVERRPVGEITKPDYWKEFPAMRKRLIINNK
jgi:hypothetical protein